MLAPNNANEVPRKSNESQSRLGDALQRQLIRSHSNPQRLDDMIYLLTQESPAISAKASYSCLSKPNLHFLFRAEEISHTESQLLINPDGAQIFHFNGEPDPAISLFPGKFQRHFGEFRSNPLIPVLLIDKDRKFGPGRTNRAKNRMADHSILIESHQILPAFLELFQAN